MKLSVYKNNEQLEIIEFDDSIKSDDVNSSNIEYYIGRAEDCYVFLDDRSVSRYHAKLTKQNNVWVILKMSEFGEIFVNGESIEEFTLNNGDMVTVGSFRINISSEIVENISQAPVEAEVKVEEPRGEVVPEKTDTSETNDEEFLNKEDNKESVDQEEKKIETEEKDTSDFNMSEEEPDQGPESEDGEDSFADGGEDFNSESEGFSDEDVSEESEGIDDIEGEENEDDGDSKTLHFNSFLQFEVTLEGDAAPYDRFVLQEEEVFVGRSDPAQIKLNDNEVSAKHAVIKREGNSFFIEDLNSSNGTVLNGKKINKSDLNNGDIFKIGSVTFTYHVKSALLDNESDHLMPVTQGDQEGVANMSGGMEDQFATKVGVKLESKSFLKDPAKRKKIIIGVVVLAGVLMFLPSGKDKEKVTGEKGKAKQERSNALNNKNDKGKKDKDGKKIVNGKVVKQERKYSDEEKQFLASTYTLARELFNQGKYSETIFELNKIFNITHNYKNSRELVGWAKQGLAKLEEAERKRKAEEERRIRQKRIKELVVKSTKAVKERNAVLADALFAQIMELDPENFDVPQLRAEIDAWRKEKERKELEIAQKKAERQRQVKLLSTGKILYQKKDWFKAINRLEKFLKNDELDDDLVKDATRMLAEAKQGLQDSLDPFLSSARSLKDGQDLKGAYENYSKIIKIDPSHVESLNQLNSIRETLDLRARRIYRDAIISESLSLFEDAKEKFFELQQIAPNDSEYYKKATEKLQDYLY